MIVKKWFLVMEYVVSFGHISVTDMKLYSLPASDKFCFVLIAFANSLDPDQDQHFRWFWSGSKPFDTLIVFLKEYFEKRNIGLSGLMTIAQDLSSRILKFVYSKYIHDAFQTKTKHCVFIVYIQQNRFPL